MTDSTSFTGMKGGTALVSLHRGRTCPHHRRLTQAALANGRGDWPVTSRRGRALVVGPRLTSDLTRRSEKKYTPRTHDTKCGSRMNVRITISRTTTR